LNPLRVLHLTTSDGGGGAGYFVVRLHRALRDAGVESRVLVGRKEREEPGVQGWYSPGKWDRRALKIGKRAGLNYAFLPRGRELLDHPDYRWADVLHLHNLHGGYINFLAARSLTSGKPSLMTVHDEWIFTGHCAFTEGCERWTTGCGACPHPNVYPAIERDATRIEWWLKRWALGRRDLALVCPSRHILECAKRTHFRSHPLHLVPHAVDTEAFAPGDRAAARARLGVPPGSRVILVAAHDLAADRKGLVPFLQALGRLPPARLENVTLLSFGANPEKLTAVSPAPHVALGRISGDEARRDAFLAADLTVSASMGESFGLAALESVACGTPVAAFRSGGIADVVRTGQSGSLAEPGDWGALAETTAALLADEAGRRVLAASCRALALRQFSWPRMVCVYVAQYAGLGGARAGVAA
jgi:glycosyltransferase involved in cell wall biosynthesis